MDMLTKWKVKYYIILARILEDYKSIKEAIECLD